MSARRGAKVVVRLRKKGAAPVEAPASGGFTEEELEAHELAAVVWMINCGLDVNNDLDRVSSALCHVERSLERLSSQLSPDARRARA